MKLQRGSPKEVGMSVDRVNHVKQLAEESHVLKRKAVVVLRGPFRRQEACPREAPYLIDGKADQLGDFTGRVH